MWVCRHKETGSVRLKDWYPVLFLVNRLGIHSKHKATVWTGWLVLSYFLMTQLCSLNWFYLFIRDVTIYSVNVVAQWQYLPTYHMVIFLVKFTNRTTFYNLSLALYHSVWTAEGKKTAESCYYGYHVKLDLCFCIESTSYLKCCLCVGACPTL